VLKDQFFDGYESKRATLMIKLCQIMSASRGDSLVITEQDFSRALALLEQTEKSMDGVFSGYGKSPLADVVPRVMQTLILNQEITFSKLLGLYYRDTDSRQMREIIETLKAMHFCDEVRSGPNVVIRYTGTGSLA
jgi:hypothetical protein